MILQPDMQGVDNRSTSFLADPSPVLGGLPADFRLDGVEFTDLRQHRGGTRRLRGDPEFVERAPHVDYPNTIDGLRFAVSVSFSAFLASCRQRKIGSTG